MTNISSIKTYMYCPRKVYIQENIAQEKTQPNPFYTEIKLLQNDLNDILNKNIRKIKKEMTLEEIEKTLSHGTLRCVDNTFEEIMISKNKISNEKIEEVYDDLNDQIKYSVKILSLKSKKAMRLLKKDGARISEMFFPSSMYSYYIKDDKLDLTGMCDKIEVIDGIYYPISFKNNTPPIKGVWNQDALELAAQALLIEQEFDCDVYVGFVEYQKIGERRPVVMDVNIRKGVFDVLHEMNQLKLMKKAPNVKINKKKCEMCEYANICLEKKV